VFGPQEQTFKAQASRFPEGDEMYKVLIIKDLLNSETCRRLEAERWAGRTRPAKA
jgi:hypothetical protein